MQKKISNETFFSLTSQYRKMRSARESYSTQLHGLWQYTCTYNVVVYVCRYIRQFIFSFFQYLQNLFILLLLLLLRLFTHIMSVGRQPWSSSIQLLQYSSHTPSTTTFKQPTFGSSQQVKKLNYLLCEFASDSYSKRELMKQGAERKNGGKQQ